MLCAYYLLYVVDQISLRAAPDSTPSMFRFAVHLRSGSLTQVCTDVVRWNEHNKVVICSKHPHPFRVLYILCVIMLTKVSLSLDKAELFSAV